MRGCSVLRAWSQSTTTSAACEVKENVPPPPPMGEVRIQNTSKEKRKSAYTLLPFVASPTSFKDIRELITGS